MTLKVTIPMVSSSISKWYWQSYLSHSGGCLKALWKPKKIQDWILQNSTLGKVVNLNFFTQFNKRF